MTISKCQDCERSFAHYRIRKFCSRACYTKARRKAKAQRQIKCRICGNKFSPSYLGQKACSWDCRNKSLLGHYVSDNVRAKIGMANKGRADPDKKLKRTCPTCGREFEFYISDQRREARTYCSAPCFAVTGRSVANFHGAWENEKVLRNIIAGYLFGRGSHAELTEIQEKVVRAEALKFKIKKENRYDPTGLSKLQ